MYLKRNNEFAVLQLYLKDYNRKFYLREISVLTKIPLKTTQNLTHALEKMKILKSTFEGKNKYFALHFDTPETQFFLEHAELYKTQLFLKKYPLFGTFLKALHTQDIVVLFGSFAKGTATKESDCDILIISDKKEELPLHLLPYTVHEIRMTQESYKKAKDETLLKEIEENHVLLKNHSAYINIRGWKQHGK